jgi:hypothetical protein
MLDYIKVSHHAMFQFHLRASVSLYRYPGLKKIVVLPSNFMSQLGFSSPWNSEHKKPGYFWGFWTWESPKIIQILGLFWETNDFMGYLKTH